MKKPSSIIQFLSMLVACSSLLFNTNLPKALTQEIEVISDTCMQALENVVPTLQNGRSFSVEWQVKEIPLYWQTGAPVGRPYRVIISLGGQREDSYQFVDDLLASPQMLTAMSHELINKCDEVSVVTYGRWGSGYLRTFGLIEGTVQEFKYVSQSPSGITHLKWGVEYSN